MLVYLKSFLLISMVELDHQRSAAKTLGNKMGLDTFVLFNIFNYCRFASYSEFAFHCFNSFWWILNTKSNKSFGNVNGLLLFVCTHNINKTFYKIYKIILYNKENNDAPSRLEQELFTKMNRKSANTCLTDMIHISIESFKWLLNEINQIETLSL